MGKRGRTKGRRWQSDLAKRWRDSGLYPDASSTQGAQTRSQQGLGKTPPDIEGTPWWCEAQHAKQPSIRGKLEQAEREAAEAGDDRPALAVVRPHGCGPDKAIVAMRLSEWERLVGGGG